jgi:hypothetical protein
MNLMPLCTCRVKGVSLTSPSASAFICVYLRFNWEWGERVEFANSDLFRIYLLLRSARFGFKLSSNHPCILRHMSGV